jgi:S-methylmethionine-dependent homocysteine/selenocysteine methylase
MHADWKTLLKIGSPALTESAVWERVGGDPMPLLETVAGQDRLSAIYSEYAGVARRWELPILLFAPTWRANQERSRTGANADALDFVRRFSGCVGALMGPRGDCYSPAAALPREDARAFHGWQAAELAQADFVLISTMPSVSEALGIVDVLPVPCFVSFVITTRGRLLDGMPLRDAIARIDDAAATAPLGYWINCVHPQSIIEGLAAVCDPVAIERVLGVQGNTSRLDPRTFSTAADFADEPAASFAAGLAEIHRRFSIPILGGCCGSRAEHLEALARNLVSA